MSIKQPNILILMTDQHRFDALGCAGNDSIETPNIDRLAQSGCHFTNAYCPTPVCVSSRMSFITGLRLASHRYPTNNPLPGPVPEQPTLMTLLHRAGYHTQGVGKMHFMGRHYGFQDLKSMEECPEFRIDDDYLMYLKEQGVRTRYPQGLRDLLYCQPQTTDIPAEHSKSAWVARESVECLKRHVQHRQGTPFLLWSSWIAPHPPYAPCEPYASMYDPAAMDLPVFAERPASTIPVARAMRGRLDGAHLDEARIRRIRALYYGMISQVDEGVGRILDTLEDLGLAASTVVLFLSDHGDMLGDHGLSQKNVPYEASVRIPMILRWPGRTEPGSTSAALAGIEDVLPTVIEELGLARDPGADPLTGKSLLREQGDEYVIDYGAGDQRWVAVRQGAYKYVIWARGGHEELYDLENDPHETKNLAAEDRERAAQMKQKVLAWETVHGLKDSREGDDWKTCPATPCETEVPRCVNVNEGRWPENLPDEEKDSVETYAEAFTKAISKESSLSPSKLSLGLYKKNGGHPLTGTPWEEAWENA